MPRLQAKPPLLNATGLARRKLLGAAGLGLAVPFLPGCGGGDAGPDPRLIDVVLNDTPFPTERYLRIGYTLATWEYEQDGLALQAIRVLDRASGEVVLTIATSELPRVYKEPLAPNPYMTLDKIDRYYMSIQLPIALDRKPPALVTHQLVFRDRHNAEVVVEGGEFSPLLKEKPLVIGSPLTGSHLIFINQSTMDYHYYTKFIVNQTIYNSERYAFDSMQFNDDLTAIYVGDPGANASYFNYGKTMYAVADGTVVAAADGLRENDGNGHQVTFKSLIEYAGNYVVLDIGGGRYAGFAHCKRESVAVHVGDVVRKGQAIAQLGNSGNSDAPHLHFQIMDGPDFFFSTGLPFVIESYTKVAEADMTSISNPARRVQPVRVTNAMMEENTVFDVV